jgi:hypothetical protein
MQLMPPERCNTKIGRGARQDTLQPDSPPFVGAKARPAQTGRYLLTHRSVYR